jgi:hypothetical protein
MNAATHLNHMLRALNYNPAFAPAEILHNLQDACKSCHHKKRCAHDLASGFADRTYQDYCPNADMLHVLQPWLEERISFKNL